MPDVRFPRFLLSETSGLPRAVQVVGFVTTIGSVVALILGAANPWLWVSVLLAGLLFVQGWDGYARWKRRDAISFQEPDVVSFQHVASEIPGGSTESAHFIRVAIVNEGDEIVEDAHGTLTIEVDGEKPKDYPMRWTGSPPPKEGITSDLLKKNLTPHLPEQLDVAIIFYDSGSVYVWNNESYITGYRNRDRQIDAKEFVATVRVRASGGIDMSQRFVALALNAGALVHVLKSDEAGFDYPWFEGSTAS